MPFFRRRPKEPTSKDYAHARTGAEPKAAPDLPTGWADWNIVPPDRIELAREIEACDDFGVEVDGDRQLQVALYDDVRTLVGDEAIEALPPKIAALDGVDECVHADRELIEVVGSITEEQLAAFVVAELARSGNPDFWEDRTE